MLRSRLKVPLAMLRRAWMSLWAPLSLLMRLPRYVKSSMHSSSSPLIVIGDAVGALTNITLVFFWLICRPVRFAKLVSRLDFSWRWLWAADMTARSSAKSRSSKHENRVHSSWDKVLYTYIQHDLCPIPYHFQAFLKTFTTTLYIIFSAGLILSVPTNCLRFFGDRLFPPCKLAPTK